MKKLKVRSKPKEERENKRKETDDETKVTKR